ncbi:UDP-glycosyltransferase 89B2-like [Fagus crenata]
MVFSPSGAMAVSKMHTLWRDLPRRENPHDENEVVSFTNIPNSPKYRWWQLSPLYDFIVASLKETKIYRNSSAQTKAITSLQQG